MSERYLNCTPGKVIEIPSTNRMPESFYIIDEESIDAINAAIATRRPLLVRGEPGTGKSALARAAATELRRAFLPHAVDARTETRDLLWSMDAVRRLATAQILGALGVKDDEKLEERMAVGAFIRPGPLWWAFDWRRAKEQAPRGGAREPDTPPGWTIEHGAVVLVDEIDKADPSVPNGLLDALGHGCFDVEGCEPVTMNRDNPPLVIITTNEERVLPDAFLRRCLVLHLALPEQRSELVEMLVARGRAHFPECARTVLSEAAEQVATSRAKLAGEDISRPGVAEYIDMVRAVIEQRDTEKEQLALLKRVARFALQKHPPGAPR